MPISTIKENTLRYLGYTHTLLDDKMDALVEDCIQEIQAISTPRFMHHQYTLTHHPLAIQELQLTLPYSDLEDLFDSCYSCIVVGCTLGQAVDRRLKYLSKVDMTKMTVLDAAASSYIEYVCDEFEEKLAFPNRTFRFCPGYGNVDITLNKTLANTLNMQKLIGLTVQDSNILLPQKSMIGLIGIGDTKYQKHCFTCIKKTDCEFRKRGQRCYKKI